MSFVLIVEPEEVNAARIRAILESLDLDFEYELVMSAEAAILSAENRKPDVFIGDMQMPVMSGTELFSMIEMMSPDTIRIVMTDGGKIHETVEFMNECKAFKIIIKPCRVAEDLLVPIHAAFLYKQQCERMKQELQNTDSSRAAVEEEFAKTNAMWQKQQDELKQIQNLMIDLLSSNVDAGSDMEPKIQERLKRWYQWMIEEYVQQVINGSGNYEQILRSQVAFGHDPDHQCFFQMKNNVPGQIEPRCMNEIAYILRLVTGVCKDLQNSYQMQALIEQTDKAYILRVRYRIAKDENGMELPNVQRVKNPQIRNMIIRATKIGIAALGGQSAVLKKEQEDIVNIAIPR